MKARSTGSRAPVFFALLVATLLAATLATPAHALGEIRLVGASDTPGANYIDLTIPPGESQPLELWIQADTSMNGFAVYMTYDGQGIRLDDTADSTDSFFSSPMRNADEDPTIFGEIIRNEGTWTGAPTDTFLYAALTTADSFIGSARAAILSFTAIDTGTWTVRFLYDTSNNRLTALTQANANGTNILTLEDTGIIQGLYPDTPTIRFLAFSSDTPTRFFDAAPFDTAVTGDTVWFAAETQVITLTVTFTSTSPDSIRVASIFDSGVQVDTGAPYTASFSIRPPHAIAETTTVLTAYSVSGSSDSLVIRFRPDTTAPDTVTPISPVNGAIVETPTFLWTPSTDSEAGVREYRVQVSDSSIFGTILASETTAHPDTDLVLATPLTNGFRYWRVVAVDSVGNATYTGLRSDTFLRSDDTTDPETFVLTAPVNGTETNATAITFRWTDAIDSSPPVSYRLIVDTDMAGSYVSDTTIAETFVTLTLPANDTYLWRVIATDLVGETRLVGDSTLIIDTAPPAAAALLAPAIDHETRVPSILFSWSASSDSLSGVAGYRLQFDTAPGFGAVLIDSSVGTGTSALRDLPANETWYWRVLVMDDAGNGAYSETRSLVVDTTTPTVGTLTAPSVTYDTNASTISFSWSAATDTLSGVAGYLLQVDTAGTFASLVADSATTLTNGSLTLAANDTFYWRVIAIDDAGNRETYTPARQIRIDTTPPFGSTLTAPASPTETSATSISFSWSAASDTHTSVAGYRIQVDTAGTFAALIADSATTLTNGTLTLAANDTYYWRILMIDTVGNSAPTTESRVLKIDTTPPVPGTLVLPADATETRSTSIFFSWNAGTDTHTAVTGYRLQVDTAGTFIAPIADSATTLTNGTLTLPANDTYRWRVVVIDSVGNTAASESRGILIDTIPPVAPAALHPTASSETNAAQVAFAWSASADTLSGVAGYRLQVDTTGAFTGILAIDTTLGGTETAIALPNGSWRWRIIAIDDAGNTTPISAISFLVDRTAPMILTASIVSSATNYFTDSGGIDTTAVADTVFFNNSGAGANQVCTITITVSGESTVIFPALFGDAALTDTASPYLRAHTIALGTGDTTMIITARDTAGNEDSITINWIRDTSGPPPVALTTPIDSQTIGDTTPTLIWGASVDTGAGTRGYLVQISDSSAFATITESAFVTATNYTSSGLNDSTWFWRVIPHDTVANAETAAAMIRRFKVDSGVPSIEAITVVSSVDTRFYADSPVTPGLVADTVWYNPTGVTQTCTVTIFVSDVNESFAVGSTAFVVIQGIDTGLNKDSYILVYQIPADSPSALVTIEVTDATGFMDTTLIRFEADTAPPTNVTPSSPPDLTDTSATAISFSWSAATDAGAGFSNYRLQIDTAGTFVALVQDSTTTLTSGVLTLAANDTYYWRIVSVDRVGNETAGAAFRIRTDTTPPIPGTLVLPADATETRSTSIFFSWNAGTDTHTAVTGYRLQVDTAGTFVSLVADSATPLTNGTLTLPANDTYRWRVVVIDSAGNTAASESRGLLVDTITPSVGTLTAPGTTYDTNSTTISFTWGAAADSLSGVAGYLLQVDTAGAFVALVQDSATTLTSGVLALAANDTYYWRVIAIDDAGNRETYTPARQIRIDTTPPFGTTLTAPASPTETSATSISFSWSTASDTHTSVAGYRIQVDTAGTFAALVADSATTLTSGTLTLPANDTYYWRVLMIDTVGNSAPTAETRVLKIDTTPPVPGTLLLPADVTETRATSIFFSWNAGTDSHTGVTGYRLQVDTAGTFVSLVADSATTLTNGTLTLPANDTYRWQVVVIDSAGNTAASESRGLLVDTITPSVGSLSAPAANTDTNAVTISFSWSAAADSLSGIAGYRLQVDTAGTFTALAWDSATPLVTGALTLAANDTYFWRVLAIDDAGNIETYASPRQLRIDTAIPDSPALTVRNGDTIAPANTLAWTAATDSLTGIACYVIQIDTAGTFAALVESATLAGNDTDHVVVTALVDTYWWRVLAYDSAGNIAVSNPVRDSFRILASDTTPPDSFNLTSPADLTGTSAVSITLRWQDATDDTSPPVTYRIQVDTAGTFAAPWTDTSWQAETWVTLTFPANETHSWRVIAKDAAGNTETSTATWKIIVDTEPPFGSTLSAPANPTDTSTTSIVFSWSAATDSLLGLAGYRLQVDTVGNFAAPLSDSATTLTNGTLALSANDTYYWRVMMVDTVGNAGATTETRLLRIDTTPPVPGTLTAPADATETRATSIIFSWNAGTDSHTGVTGYRLQVDTAGTFVSLVADSATTLTNGTLALPANDTYRWRVVVIDSAGNTAASESRGLLVDTITPSVGSLTSPAADFDTNGTTIAFSWSAAADSLSGVAGYRLQVDTAGTFTALAWDSATTLVTGALTLAANDTYYWRVLAVDDAGNIETYASPRQIRVDTAAPDSPTLTAHNGDTLTTPITLAWTASSDSLTGVAWYVIQIDTSGAFTALVESATLAGNDTDHIVATTAVETYFWRVLAYDTVGNIAVSNPVRDSFLLILGDTRPPESFTLTSPTDRTGTNAVSITLRWQDANDDTSPPVTYRIQVDTAGTFAAPWTDTFWQAETWVTLTFSANETHSWRVIARDAAGNTETSIATWRIIVDTTVPTTPVLATHAGDSIEVPGTLRWTASSDTHAGVAGYIIQIDTSGTFISTYETGLTYGLDTDYVTSSLTPETTWYWRVLAVDSAGNIAIGATDSFLAKTADSTAPTTFSLTAPANTTLTGTAVITFQWATSTDAISSPVTYRLQVDTAGTFAAPAVDTNWITETYATISLPKSDTWYWRVFARDNALTPNTRQSSETWTIMVDTEPPSSPVLTAHQGATRVTPMRLTWTAVTDSISGVRNLLVQLDNAQPFAAPYTESIYVTPSDTSRWTAVLAAGTYYWTVTAYDTLGNAASSSPTVDSFIVVNDTTAPSADTVTAPTLDNSAATSCTVPVYITDNAVVETVVIDLRVVGGAESTAAVPNTPPPSTDSLWVVTIPADSTVSGGTYELVVTYIDASGNTGTTTIRITITDNSPSVAAILDTPLAFLRAGGEFISIVSTYGDSYSQVEYQYREAGIGAWKTCTPAAGAANPDTVGPFWGFFWDITDTTEFLNGREYDVTARATVGGVTDPSPGYYRVEIDRIDSTHYEYVNAAGEIEVNMKVSPDTITELRTANTIPGRHGTVLTIPTGAVTETTWIRVIILATTPPPAAPISTGFIADSTGIFRQFQVHGQNGTVTFQQPLTITLPYDDGDTANDAVRQTSIQEADLAIYYYDERRQVWLAPSPSTVDPVRNVVTATTDHFTIFAVLARVPAAANLANIIIYPNPYVPNDGNVRTGTPYDGTPNSGIIFDNLPQQVTIEIYSIAGKLVARMQKNDAFGRYNWDAKNDDNQNVASGMYLIVIKSGTGERVVKKVMIIR